MHGAAPRKPPPSPVKPTNRILCFLCVWPACSTGLSVLAGVRGWGLINGLVLKEESPVLAGAVVGETTELGLLLVPAGLKVR